MNSQISIRLPTPLLEKADEYADKKGYGSVQNFIRETIREKLFEPEVTREELQLIKRVAKKAKEEGLYGNEEELWQALEATKTNQHLSRTSKNSRRQNKKHPQR